MAARARLIDGADVYADCAGVAAPTLVINGEPGLDHVVPAESTAAFASAIAAARNVTLARTGHFGPITRPRLFADEIERFLRDSLAAGETTHAA
jgi:pimeloyl-ACP methyl ester carboxylesterase